MKTKRPVQIENLVLRNRNRRPHGVISRFPVRHHQVQPVRRTALKQHHQLLAARLRTCNLRQHTSFQEGRDHSRAHQRHRAATHKNPTGNAHETEPLPIQTQVVRGSFDFPSGRHYFRPASGLFRLVIP